MKKFVSIILSTLLAFAAMPAAMANASAVMPEDYSYELWSENFDGDATLDTTNTFTKSNFAHSFVNNRVELTYNPETYTGSYPSNFLFVMKSGNSTAPVQSSGKTVSELSKMQVSFDILASTSNQLSIAFRDQFSETAAAQSYGVTSYIATMKADGTLSFMGSNSSYSYQTGDLLSFDIFFDFTGTTGKYSLYINNQMVVENASIDNNSMKCVEALRFETKVNEEKEAFTYGVDNIRFAIPEPCGYEHVITEHSFDDLTAGTAIPSTYKLSATAPSEVKIVADSDGVHGNCLQFTGTGAAVGVGISKSDDWDYPTEAPKLVKLEMDLKRKNAVAVYIFAQTPSGGTQKALMLWGSDKELKFNNGNGSRANSGIKVAENDWVTVEMYFNYTTSKYYVYIDGSYTGEYNIDTDNVANLETLYVSGNNQISVDNLKISTIPAYALPVISEYKAPGVTKTDKMAFVAKNSETSEKMYKILLAKYTAAGVLDSVTISDGSVAASATELEELTYPTLASDGSYYRYFIFDSMSNIVPLVESITIE